MDPQQRHVLETSYEALFNSGDTNSAWAGSASARRSCAWANEREGCPSPAEHGSSWGRFLTSLTALRCSRFSAPLRGDEHHSTATRSAERGAEAPGYRKAQLQRAYIAVFTGGTHPEYSWPGDDGERNNKVLERLVSAPFSPIPCVPLQGPSSGLSTPLGVGEQDRKHTPLFRGDPSVPTMKSDGKELRLL